MKRILVALVAALPLTASAAMLSRAELLELIPNAKINGGAYDYYYDDTGRIEQWMLGAKRVGFDREGKERPEGFVADGEWYIKSVPLPEDFDQRSAEEQEQIREQIEARNAELRSVFCTILDERTKCWDVERRSEVRVDPADPDSALARTQDYHLYREGRAETRDIVITAR